MFNKLLASIGIGSAKVDLVLNQEHLVMGEPIHGTIKIRGGKVAQEIEGLSVELRLSSRFQKDDQTIPVNETLAKVEVTRQKFIIQPNEYLEYPFHFICPMYLPVSSVTTRYYFRTSLEIDSGLDSHDRDYVTVYPTGLQKNFLDAFHALGFVHQYEGYTGKRYGGRQIIKFQPTTWLRGQFDEVEFSYNPRDTQNCVSGFFELDKRTTGITGFIADKLDLDEKKGMYYFDAQDLATLDKAIDTIRRFIIENSKGLIG